jgi:hypothetical protein
LLSLKVLAGREFKHRRASITVLMRRLIPHLPSDWMDFPGQTTDGKTILLHFKSAVSTAHPPERGKPSKN